MVDIQSATAEIRREKIERRQKKKKKKPQGKNIKSASATQGGRKKKKERNIPQLQNIMACPIRRP